MPKKLLSMFCISALCLNLLIADSLYFMPKEQNEAFNALLNTIKNTQNKLDIAIYSFTNREISKAIRDIARKGVKVRIIYNKKNNKLLVTLKNMNSFFQTLFIFVFLLIVQ